MAFGKVVLGHELVLIAVVGERVVAELVLVLLLDVLERLGTALDVELRVVDTLQEALVLLDERTDGALGGEL